MHSNFGFFLKTSDLNYIELDFFVQMLFLIIFSVLPARYVNQIHIVIYI